MRLTVQRPFPSGNVVELLFYYPTPHHCFPTMLFQKGSRSDCARIKMHCEAASPAVSEKACRYTGDIWICAALSPVRPLETFCQDWPRANSPHGNAHADGSFRFARCCALPLQNALISGLRDTRPTSPPILVASRSSSPWPATFRSTGLCFRPS